MGIIFVNQFELLYFEDYHSEMIDKDTKIHSLGPKKISSTAKGFFTASTPNGFYQNKQSLPVVTVSQPQMTVSQPQIRYLLVQHPQFDTLVKELSLLRIKYDDLLVKFDQKCTQQSLRENLQQVMKSTHDIEVKMSRIVEDANQMARNSQQKENFPTVQAEKKCLQIINTVNKATEKIEELEGKNAKLQEEISMQREWKEALEAENKRLSLMMQNIETEKQQEIERLRQELHQLKQRKIPQVNPQNGQQKVQNSQRVQGERYLANNMKKSKKITNLHYLNEDIDEMDNDISGFSRLSIIGDASRISRVYQ